MHKNILYRKNMYKMQGDIEMADKRKGAWRMAP